MKPSRPQREPSLPKHSPRLAPSPDAVNVTMLVTVPATIFPMLEPYAWTGLAAWNMIPDEDEEDET